MKKILDFFLKNKDRLLFLILLGISLTLIIQTHSYHRSKVIGSVNSISLNVSNKIESADKYLKLKEENYRLAQENAALLSKLFAKQANAAKPKIDSVFGISSETIVVSKVIRNTYNLQNNYLTINSGLNENIKPDMGVVNELGVVGVINNVSPHFATVTSILNTKSLINAKIKKNNYFGSLTWNGKSTGFAQLTDVPRSTSIKVGDTIVTGGLSVIFPENVDIGTIYKIENYDNNSIISVKLFNDMTNLGYVYVIKSKVQNKTTILNNK